MHSFKVVYTTITSDKNLLDLPLTDEDGEVDMKQLYVLAWAAASHAIWAATAGVHLGGFAGFFGLSAAGAGDFVFFDFVESLRNADFAFESYSLRAS